MKSNVLISRFVDTLDSLDIKGIHIPGLIMSSPGVGKTSSLEMYAKFKDYNMLSLIASQYNSDDILGLQSVQNGKLCKLAPSWYNHLLKMSENGKRTILFIDEITTCDEFIQSPLLNLIFNKSLGEFDLPDNCFIIAAGNYSEELNGAFSVTAPMVNRFLILNVMAQDLSVSEAISHSFRLVDKDRYEDYLGLATDRPKFDYKKLESWMKNVLTFTPSNITNNREEGLLGFCTIRSIGYCMDYASEYMSRYADLEWTRVVGDSLGKYKSGDNWLPFRMKLMDSLKSFMLDKGTEAEPTLIDLIRKYNSSIDLDKYETLDKIRKYVADPDRLTNNEVRSFTDYCKKHLMDDDIQHIYSSYMKTLNDISIVSFD